MNGTENMCRRKLLAAIGMAGAAAAVGGMQSGCGIW
ncbi:twin-arginine translocation signal domain-containing protein [Paenibacillus hodogayensis]|uniref:Twin-arginine translocation signal domain-containing protein n=1 Tax=Paenibacillus hodogayensis TaxID=279208 RepID=A0ABV5VTE0_9BACL